MPSGIEIYQSPDGRIQVEVRFEEDTVWLTQLQMAELFDKDVRTINEHILNIYRTGELERESTIRKFRMVRKEGKREVARRITHYNLDMVISVGYRVNSLRGTQFRRWATKRLRDYLVQGFALNERRLRQLNLHVQTLKSGLKILSCAVEERTEKEALSWLKIFAKGLELLDHFDQGMLDERGYTIRPARYPLLDEYRALVEELRSKNSSDLFGRQKDQGFESALTQIAQKFGGKELYPSLEEKAAMLLYLIVKNHAFVDGNKRIAAACFLLFLERNEMLWSRDGKPLISNDALAALTLFVAASKPEELEQVKCLIISVLNRRLHD